MSADALLELHAAAGAFLNRRDLKDEPARRRLRAAIAAVLCVRRDAVLILDRDAAFDALAAIVARCIELRCDWTEIAAIVNREARSAA